MTNVEVTADDLGHSWVSSSLARILALHAREQGSIPWRLIPLAESARLSLADRQ